MSRYALLLLLLVAACGGDKAFHHEEDFSGERRHRQEFAAAPEIACEAARHVLVGQGYVVSREEEAREIVLFGQKEFREKDQRHAVLQMQVICGPRGQGAAIHAAAVESHFDVARSESKATLGLPVVAPLSIGVARSNREQLKLAGESIADNDFYAAFFKAVERELRR